ncbi:MAG: aldehyde reductase [Solirubrobacteraceae bacterium]
MAGELVLVTGGSGFVASHCIVQLIDAGYRVRATLRTLGREPEVLEMLRTGGIVEPEHHVEFIRTDLLSDEGWAQAVAGCAYVLHVASPFPARAPKDEGELILPAREGALRVLRAARAGGVKRVVLTSSFAAVGYGHGPVDRPFTEDDWTDVSGDGIGAYTKSKTLAERAAWDFVADGGGPELVTINPTAVLGPLLGPDRSASIQLVERMLEGGVPGAPKLSFGVVDVRDVADLHLRAMVDPVAAGERFLAVAGPFVSVHEVAMTLRARLGDRAKHVPTRELPNWLVRIAGHFDRSLGERTGELGKRKAASSDKARRLLGWTPRSNEDAIAATGESLLRLGVAAD